MLTLTVKPTAPLAADQVDDLSGHAHRQLIGYIGLVLPFLLIALALARDGLERWRALESISAYYYTGAVTAFAGMLVALALFLFAYRGYGNAAGQADRWAAKLASLAALGVAFFPTAAPAGLAALPWWTPATGIIHHVSAIVLFAIFALFCLWLFRITPEGGSKMDGKGARNHLYLACGIVIVGCILYAGWAGSQGRSIFWPESIALGAFALSWLAKGRALRSAVGVARRMLSGAKGG
jgi:succinate dehydrogenase/fumarate reductase cytochrome b subunit